MCLRESSDGANPFISATATQLTPKLYYTYTKTAGLAFGGTGLCSYRVRGVDGSCAEHLTTEFYTVVMLLTFILSYMYYY